MKKKIRRKCKCGCGKITNCGKKYIYKHHLFGNTHTLGHKLSRSHKKKLSLIQMGKKHSEESRLKISLALVGNMNTLGFKHSKKTKREMSLALMGNTHTLGHKQSKQHILNNSLANIKCNPNYEYCDIWKDKEYKKDLRKDFCENINCKNNSKNLNNHHIYLDKKRCSPNDIMTLCNSCHAILHNSLGNKASPKDYIIINRPGYVSYIHKRLRRIIRINKGR